MERLIEFAGAASVRAVAGAGGAAAYNWWANRPTTDDAAAPAAAPAAAAPAAAPVPAPPYRVGC